MRKTACVLSAFLMIMGGAQASLIIDEASDIRVDDLAGTGSGTRTVITSDASRILGYHTSVNNMNLVYVFQMTAGFDSSSITAANFSVSQKETLGANNFNIDAYVIRTSSSDRVLTSDYQDYSVMLMDDFSDNGTTGSMSLDATAQTTLGTYLKDNWADGEYVFIGLKSDPFTIVSDSNTYSKFSADGVLTVIPEPATFMMLGFGTVAMMFIRRRIRQ